MADQMLIIPMLASLDEPLGTDKDSVIKALAAKIAASGRADENGLVSDLLAREAKSATGMPGGIAIPHCRSQAVNTAALAFARLKEPVAFGAPDGPADLIFMIAAAEGQGQEHLQLLKKLAQNLVDKNFLAALRSVDSAEKAAQIIMGAVSPAVPPVPTPAPVEKQEAAPRVMPEPAVSPSQAPVKSAKRRRIDQKTPDGQGEYLVAVTSCPTGIAHTYMAADALLNKGKELGIPVHVEAQGSGHLEPLDPNLIAGAAGAIFAHDISVQDPERFSQLSLVDVGVKAAINDPEKLIREAIAKSKNPQPASASAVKPDGKAKISRWGGLIPKAVMAGVSYMIPFVAAGGLLIALGFLLGGYDVADPAQDISLNFSLWKLPDAGPSGKEKSLPIVPDCHCTWELC
ncbi:fructose PTS transporter subunit IIA [Varibaculum cambriense]|nr:fructose PTS transporter subunit IIA [Varibaculum cambriense]